jgi:putative transposase
VAVDTMGLVLAVLVTSAGLQDDDYAASGELLLRLFRAGFTRLRLIWADPMYEGRTQFWARLLGWALQVVRRPPDAKGFTLLPRRWVVERTFAWLGRYRRLSKDYEYHPHNSEAMIHLALINLMVHRLRPG